MTKAFNIKPLLAKRAWELYRRKGFRSVVNKAIRELGRRNPFRRQIDPQTGLAAFGTNPGAIFSSVDLPVDGKEEATDTLYVSGWACSMAGIRSIDLFVDKQPVKQIQTGMQRADVGEAHPSIPNSKKSGFANHVNIDRLQVGKHELLIALHDRAGNSRLITRIFKRSDPAEMYHAYYLKNLVSAREIKVIKRQLNGLGKAPFFRIWIDCSNKNDLKMTLRSLCEQEYPDWYCYVIAEQADHQRLNEVVDAVADANLKQRIEVCEVADVSTDRDNSTNNYHGFLHAGETLSANALYLWSERCIQEPDADVIYSDHDLSQASGLHLQPYFKPDWSPDYLLSRDYVGGFFLAKNADALSSHLSKCFETGKLAWRFDLLLRLTDGCSRVAHIPRVLWSRPASSPVDVMEQEEQVIVQQALDRRNLAATVARHSQAGTRRITWPVKDNPKVSIIIPTTGRMDHLSACVESIGEKTAYSNYEQIFIDNSRGKNKTGVEYLKARGLPIIERDEPFNWAKLNNDGAKASDSDLLLFLNDDVEVVDENWLTELVSQAMRPDVGTVGAQLLYPNGRIQHAGIFLVGHGGGAMHFFHGLDPEQAIYQNLHRITREVSANTGACLMVKRSHFDEIGGFDEDLEIVGNDVDFCLRLAERGYRSIWTPYCRLLHHESVSRSDITIELDEKKIWDRWADLLRKGDPYFNPNFVQNRPDLSTDFSGAYTAAESAAAAQKETGINLIGYIRAEMGIGEATRGEAHAMDEAGVPFVVIDYRYGNPARMGDDTWAYKISDKPEFDINLLHVNADLTPRAFFALTPEVFANRYTIGFWAWELPEFPDDWLSSFTLVNEVWVPSAFVHDAVSRKSTVPVVRIPHAVPIPSGPFLKREYFKLPNSAYQFLVMYDVNSVSERKNPKGAIRAFTMTFEPDDASVSLVIKLNNAQRSEINELNAMIDGYSNIFVIDRTLARHEILSLHACSDCFISLHRSEGFGLTIAEAMSVSKPVIATYWSGNVDFMNTQNAACVNYEIVELNRDFGPYNAGQRWAEPDLEHASWWMKKLRNEPDVGAAMGNVARSTVAKELSPLRVGQLIRQRLKYIRKT